MQYIDRVKKENKMISVKEFREQLKLMEKQYGAEEELYPYIYMLLREAGMTQKCSVRSVAGAGSRDDDKWKYKNLFMGYASFPDIAIIDKGFKKSKKVSNKYYESEIRKLFCCVEAKSLEKSLLNIGGTVKIKTGSAICIKYPKQHYQYYRIMAYGSLKDKIGDKYKISKKMNEDGIVIEKWVKNEKNEKFEYQKIDNNTEELMFEYNKTKDGVFFCIKDGDKELLKYSKDKYSEDEFVCTSTMPGTPPTLEDVLKEDSFEVIFVQNVAIANINNGNSDKNRNYDLIDMEGKIEDCGQLLGELLWYGRVIYTNGYQWKYLEIVDFNKSDDGVNLANKRNELREKCIMVNKKEKNKWCVYFNTVSFQIKETPLITIDDSTTEIEWEDFKTKLRNISKDWNKTCKEKYNE